MDTGDAAQDLRVGPEETYNPWSIVNLVFRHLADEGLCRDENGVWRRLAPDGYVLAGQLGQRLKAQGLTPREIRVRRPSLEQLFALVSEARRAA